MLLSLDRLGAATTLIPNLEGLGLLMILDEVRHQVQPPVLASFFPLVCFQTQRLLHQFCHLTGYFTAMASLLVARG